MDQILFGPDQQKNLGDEIAQAISFERQYSKTVDSQEQSIAYRLLKIAQSGKNSEDLEKIGMMKVGKNGKTLKHWYGSLNKYVREMNIFYSEKIVSEGIRQTRLAEEYNEKLKRLRENRIPEIRSEDKKDDFVRQNYLRWKKKD